MVQTRRKTAAAAQVRTVKENKAAPPAPQTEVKKAKRGRPPKIRPEALALNNPSSSDTVDGSTFNNDHNKIEAQLPDACESQSKSLINKEDSFSVTKTEGDDQVKTSELFLPKNCTPEKLNSTSTDSSSSSARRSVNRLISQEGEETDETPANVALVGVESLKLADPISPAHPDDPQPSSVSITIKNKTEFDDTAEMLEPSSSSPRRASKSEEKSVTPEPDSSTQLVPANNGEYELMDIANSESDGDNDEPSEVDDDLHNSSSSSIPLPTSPPPEDLFRGEIHVDTDRKFSVNHTGSSPSERNDGKNEKGLSNPLSSPTMNRLIRPHFLHPAYASFANEKGKSPQPPPPPEPAPSQEKPDSSTSVSFKMTFKKATVNPLMKPSALIQTSTSLNTSISLTPISPSSGVDSTSSPQKRVSNFGMNFSNELPPPQMVEPKLSSMQSVIASAFSVESDSAPEDMMSPKSSASAVTTSKITESDIQAAKAKAEKAAQEIDRRRLIKDRRDDKDDYDRRRDDRDRRHRKSDSDRSEQQSRTRQREDDERRAREKEREVTKRHDREREEERIQRQKEEERKKKEDEERKQKEIEEQQQREEEEKRIEEKRIRDEEMKIPEYELITECKWLNKNANKKRTETLICECARIGGNCSDDTCVNRAMLTECPSSCPANCKNQRFAKRKYASVEPFHTGTAKGCGLRALKDIKKGRFIMEYIGEVVEKDDYEKRKVKYAADKKHKHHYLCDAGCYTIDATVYGNASRFVNHSCEPNAVCEKWSVPKTPGDVSRIGFFSKRFIKAGEEITFDYQFVNYGRDATQCLCGTPSCNGWIGQKRDDSSSNDDDDEDEIEVTRHIEMDEEEEEKLEQLDNLEPTARIELINEILSDLHIEKRKDTRKVITIATRITDHAQRETLLSDIFLEEHSAGVQVQALYAKEGMATLMAEWLEADDYSLANLKLVQVILKVLHSDVFLSCAKSDSLLREVVSRWSHVSMGDWIDVHVVVNSLVTCTDEPERNYTDVGKETEDEFRTNFHRVKDMASRLAQYWFNRSISFKIPKKKRESITKDVGRKDETPSSSSQLNDSTRSGAVSPMNHRNHHYSNPYYNDRESHPRFFNNGNDVHQYRFTGYHGNNYKANYLPRRHSKESHRDRRRAHRRSRSRSRSDSPQSNKRRKFEDRENHRGRSPTYERREARSPEARTPGSVGQPEAKESSRKTTHVEEVNASTSQPYPPGQLTVHPGPYQVPTGYEQYGMYDVPHPVPYMYSGTSGYYAAPTYPSPDFMSMSSFPSKERLSELYNNATVEQLCDRIDSVEAELKMLRNCTAKKRAEREAIDAENRKLAKEEEARRLATIEYTWAAAKSDQGETYYYNKVTKEVQWHVPTAEQGLLEPEGYVCTAQAAILEEQRLLALKLEPKTEVQDYLPSVVKEELDDKEQQLKDRQQNQRASTENSSVSPNSNRDRDRREGSRHRDHSSRKEHREGSTDDRRIRDFKHDLERSIRSVVRSHSRLRHSHEVTSDKTTWLIKLIAKEMFKRESSQSKFDFHFSENTDRKVRNYTKSLIDRKLESNDLWKGYNSR